MLQVTLCCVANHKNYVTNNIFYVISNRKNGLANSGIFCGNQGLN